MNATQYEFNILGQKIVVKDQEAAELAEIAIKIVNEKISNIQSQKPLLSPQQVAILALLEVAGCLVQDRKSMDEYRHELDRKCSSLMTELSPMNHAV